MANHKFLNLFDIICILISSMLGAGIFEVSSSVAANIPNHYTLIFMWLLGAVISYCGALLYAELSILFPSSGGEFEYLRKIYGEKVGYLFAWSHTFIIQPGSLASIAFIFSRYLNFIFIQLGFFEKEYLTICAFILVFTIFLCNCAGNLASKFFQNFITALKTLLVMAFSLAVLFCKSDSEISKEYLSTMELDYGLALILILYTYGGWSQVAYLTEEFIEHKKNVFKSLIISMCIVATMYVFLNVSLISVLGYNTFSKSTVPALDAAKLFFSPNMAIAVAGIICICTIGSFQALFFSGARTIKTFSSNYRFLSLLNIRRNMTPLGAYFAQSLFALCIITLTTSFTSSVVYTTAVVWFFFALTALGYIIYAAKHGIKKLSYFLSACIFVSASVYCAYSAFSYSPVGTLISILIIALGYIPYFNNLKENKI